MFRSFLDKDRRDLTVCHGLADIEEYIEGASLYLPEDANDVADVLYEEDEEVVEPEFDVSRERSLGAGMLLPRTIGE